MQNNMKIGETIIPSVTTEMKGLNAFEPVSVQKFDELLVLFDFYKVERYYDAGDIVDLRSLLVHLSMFTVTNYEQFKDFFHNHLLS